MNYQEAQEYLKEIQEQGAKLSLANIQKLIDNLPLDLKRIKFIQVAGTNGKGSTAHFITSILKSAGYKVGLFTSPHLEDIRERITVDKTWISQDQFAHCLSRIRDISRELLGAGKIDNIPTFFEHLLLTAIYHFYEQNAGYAVLEVGLGGRLDATSTVTPGVSVITNISYDHTKNLGKRIRDIATEKAGIIKRGVPVVCGCKVGSVANRVIREIARQKEAPFYNVLGSGDRLDVEEIRGAYHCTYTTAEDTIDFDVKLNGIHQAHNAATAVKAIKILARQNHGFKAGLESIRRGIAENFVPGRIEVMDTTPKIILDGGHNLESIKALSHFLHRQQKRDLTLVFGVLRDKKYRKMIPLILPYSQNVIITEPVSKRALAAEKLVKYFNGNGSRKNIQIIKQPGEALDAALRLKKEILITGSLYLAGAMRNIISGGRYRQKFNEKV